MTDNPMPMAGSQRLAAVQAPIIPTIAALTRDHPGTISLGQGVVGYGPPPEAFDYLRDRLDDPALHKYGPVEGLFELRRALADKLADQNHIARDSECTIVVTAGSNMAFHAAVLAITEPGDEVILLSPYYFNHDMAITMAGCRTVSVATDPHCHPQVDLIQSAITARTRAIVTVSPNNPSGAVYSQTTLTAINELCGLRGLYHISDEAYEDFTYDQARHFTPASLATATPHTITLFSLSKGYGFAGWRIGYMLPPDHLIAAVKKIQDTNLICPPMVSQYAAVGALRAGRGYIQTRTRGIGEIRMLILAQLRELGPLIDPPRAEGAFYVLLKVNTGLDDFQLTEGLIRDHGVAVIPGSAFGITQGCYLRIAYGSLDAATARAGSGRLIDGLRALTAQ